MAVAVKDNYGVAVSRQRVDDHVPTVMAKKLLKQEAKEFGDL